MVAKMKAMLIARQGKYSTAPYPNKTAQPSSSTYSKANQMFNGDSNVSKEAPHKNPPIVIDLEKEKTEKEKKEKPAAKTKEGTRRLAKIEECLSNQGYELAYFYKISPFAKIEIPPNYKEKYNWTGYPRAHLKYYLCKIAYYSDYIPLLMDTF